MGENELYDVCDCVVSAGDTDCCCRRGDVKALECCEYGVFAGMFAGMFGNMGSKDCVVNGPSRQRSASSNMGFVAHGVGGVA